MLVTQRVSPSWFLGYTSGRKATYTKCNGTRRKFQTGSSVRPGEIQYSGGGTRSAAITTDIPKRYEEYISMNIKPGTVIVSLHNLCSAPCIATANQREGNRCKYHVYHEQAAAVYGHRPICQNYIEKQLA